MLKVNYELVLFMHQMIHMINLGLRRGFSWIGVIIFINYLCTSISSLFTRFTAKKIYIYTALVRFSYIRV